MPFSNLILLVRTKEISQLYIWLCLEHDLRFVQALSFITYLSRVGRLGFPKMIRAKGLSRAFSATYITHYNNCAGLILKRYCQFYKKYLNKLVYSRNPLHSCLEYLLYRNVITKIVDKCTLDTFFVTYSQLSSPRNPTNRISEIACLFACLFYY